MPLTLHFKLVKPKAMKASALRLELLSGMHQIERGILKDFRKTTRTWEHKVKFTSQISTKGPGPEVLVGTDDAIYRYVNDGTPAHDIWAGIYTGRSRARVLRFGSKFKPKTRVRTIASYKGVKGGATIMRPYVRHPGTKAREFDKVLQKRWQGPFSTRMRQAMRRAAAKSGHAVR